MIIKWCLAAAHAKKVDNNLMAVDMNVAYAAVPAFTTWQWQRLDFTLVNQQDPVQAAPVGWGNSDPITTYWVTMATNLHSK